MFEPSLDEADAVLELIVTHQYPNWWHPWGIAVVPRTITNAHLELGNSHATVRIEPPHPSRPDQFYLYYELRPTDCAPPYTSRSLFFTPDQVRQMFDLDREPLPTFMYEGKYPATRVLPSRFIRLGNFLNITSPGSGQDGDFSVSLYLFDRIREAVANLLTAPR